MSIQTPSPPAYDDVEKLENGSSLPSKDGKEGSVTHADTHTSDLSSLHGLDVLSLQDLDPALNMKMHLVNNVSE